MPSDLAHLPTRTLLAERARLARRRRDGAAADRLRARIEAELERRRDRRMARAGATAPDIDPEADPAACRTPAGDALFPDIAAEDADRAAWRDLVERELPAAARGRAWPVSEDHCFARILLDATLGRPWRDVVRPPAWRNAPVGTLRAATALGRAVLAGEADLAALDRRSRALRGKR